MFDRPLTRLAPTLAGLALTFVAIGLTSCTGGSSGASVVAASCQGSDPNVLCLQSCNLGCTQNGCELTDIAQNQPIILQFNQPVDPRTVDNTTIQLRTASGEEPVGEYLVTGSTVQFVPQVLVVGNTSFFGFKANETYRLFMPGGPGNAINSVRSTGGDPMERTFSCFLTVTRGIIDLNQSPPRARLISPASVFNAPIDTTIVLEFNELLDVTPFVGTTATNGPVGYSVRRTRPASGGSGAQLECNPNSPPTPMVGTPQLSLDPIRGVSTLRYQPPTTLPGSICVQVNVTDRVLDLAGVPANPQIFQFITEETARVTRSIAENFDDDLFLDRDLSSGSWSGGLGRFGRIGGDGRHGSFDQTLGRSIGMVGGKDTYVWNTENLLIPGPRTLSGNNETVTDGRFFFSDMLVPRNVRLRFEGNNPVSFTIRGRIEVEGEIELRGGSVPGGFDGAPGSPVMTPGQPGASGGPFAGAGGKGGDRCQGTGADPAFNGVAGGDVRVRAGHAFAGNTQGTGGRGSPLFPANGLNTSIVAPAGSFFSFQATSGGGGGGNRNAGGQGRAVSNSFNDPSFLGPPTNGGAEFPLDADPATPGIQVPSGRLSSQHFLVGGSGGGGGGSHPLFTNTFFFAWSAGAGGGGGGGALALRAGDFLRVSSFGSLLCQGGSGAAYTGSTSARQGTPAPGGGGAGGAILLQSGRETALDGTINVSGGTGGLIDRGFSSGGSAVVVGGDGSPGYLRLETPGTPSPGQMPGAMPPATAENVAPLTETDEKVAFQSEFYSTGQTFGPEYLRYEVEALVGGTRMVFSDDPAVGVLARPGTQPIGVLLQAARIDLATGAPDPNSILPWRVFAGTFGAAGSELGLADDALNGFRFLIILDRGFGQTVEIDKLTVFYRI